MWSRPVVVRSNLTVVLTGDRCPATVVWSWDNPVEVDSYEELVAAVNVVAERLEIDIVFRYIPSEPSHSLPGVPMC